MAQRTFGPVRGAGTQVTEQEGAKPIQPAALGQVGYAGVFEKGDVGKLLQIPTKASFRKKMGSYYDGTLAPDAAIDFLEGASGAGGLWAVRVTDGNELQASIDLFARRATLKTKMGTIKAKNGGRWGGKRYNFVGTAANIGAFTATALTTALASTWKKDQLKGGTLEIDAVVGKSYPIVGNTAAGVITVASDANMNADLVVAGGSNFKYYVSLANGGKAVSVLVRDGEEKPDVEFALDVFVDGKQVKTYPNLSTDPANAHYWINTINDDDGNDEIFVVDSFTGAQVASVRPASYYGVIATVTAELLTATIFDKTNNSPSGGNATFALGAVTDAMLEQTLTLTFTSATAFNVTSDKLGALGSGTLGVAFVSPNKYVPGFTATAGGTPMVASDTIAVRFKPFLKDELIGGFVYPDKVNSPRTRFRIVANDHNTITVAAGSDMTGVGATSDEFMVACLRELAGGRDGIADLTDAHYTQQAFDTTASPFNQLSGKGLGLVKLATPGVTATAVQKAGAAYVEAKNLQYRYEIPDTTVTEAGAEAYVDTTLGRNNYVVVSFPSYGYVADPEGNAGMKLVTLTGQIHGRESSIAKDFDGYHKAAAGIDATLPKVLKLPTGDVALDEEFLNPLGINVIKKARGNFILWGDRTLSVDSEWRFKHQREMMTHYERTLIESFDFIIFAINDEREQAVALTSLRGFFLPEWRKRALRGKTFAEAATIKIDNENNTDATRGDGDLFADISLKLADTVERFRIRISKQGLFEATA